MNTLTPEQLDMIKRLQPFFKERMGEWQEGDSLLYFGKTGIAPKRNDKFGLEAYIDGLHQLAIAIGSPELLHIPKPIDWQNPERGLWGMIDSKKDMSEQKFVRNENNKVHLLVFKNGTALEFFTPDPFTALLKALCEQEGV